MTEVSECIYEPILAFSGLHPRTVLWTKSMLFGAVLPMQITVSLHIFCLFLHSKLNLPSLVVQNTKWCWSLYHHLHDELVIRYPGDDFFLYKHARTRWVGVTSMLIGLKIELYRQLQWIICKSRPHCEQVHKQCVQVFCWAKSSPDNSDRR